MDWRVNYDELVFEADGRRQSFMVVRKYTCTCEATSLAIDCFSGVKTRFLPNMRCDSQRSDVICNYLHIFLITAAC